ncbi:unnamed protein product, partial [Trichobilharzia regenti]
YTSDEIDTDEEKALNELFAPSSNEFYKSHWCIEGCEGSRVLLIATILVNLVTPPPVVYASSATGEDDDDDELDFGPIGPCSLFPNGIPLATWRDNARVIAANPNALRFIYLCCYAQHSGLKSLGLQLLSSIRYPLDPPSVPLPLDCPNDWTPLIDNGCRLGQLTLAFLTRCILESSDRCDLIAVSNAAYDTTEKIFSISSQGLMFLANLTKVRDKGNLSSLVVGLPQTVWPRLAQLLCLPDLAIVCATLEAMRCLTNLDATTCVTCWESCCSNLDSLDGGGGRNIPFILLQPLLALLTLEGQAMGSQSLHRIRLLPRNPQIQSQPQLSHAPNFRIPVPSRIPPPSVNDLNRPRESLHANSGQTFKTYILPKSPSKLHSIPSDSNFINDLRNPATTSSFHSLKSESSTPLKPSIITPVSCMPQPVYRPQSGSTACSGLINLLSSTTPSSSSSSNLIVSSTLLDSASSNSTINNNTSPKTITPSLSELTDRLQMPPPSLPPPSALRRSGKWPQPRNSLPSSPPPPSSSSQLPNKSKMPTPNSPCRTNCSSGNMPVMTDHRIGDLSSQLSVTSSNSKSPCSSENSTTSEKDVELSSIQTDKHVHKDSPIKLSPNQSMIKANSSRNSPPQLKSISNHEDCDNSNATTTTTNNNKNQSSPSSPCVPVVVDNETKPILVNGDEEKNSIDCSSVVVVDKELLNNSHADDNIVIINSKHTTNGLRASGGGGGGGGILQEAVLALQDKKIKLSTEQSKSADDNKQQHINGVLYTGETKTETVSLSIINNCDR